MMIELINRLFNITNEKDFVDTSLEIFRYQSRNNPVYSAWLKELGTRPEEISSLDEIPFLPVSFFRDHEVICGDMDPDTVFVSSGTGGIERSKHFVADLQVYERSFEKSFRHFYGDPEKYIILALLPSYLEREGSSLVYMADRLISLTNSGMSGFFLHDTDKLKNKLKELKGAARKIILLGVSFALLDFAEDNIPDLGDHIIMETGGMKGRRNEMVREELHEVLLKAFRAEKIHSEYGMTELLSQAYSKGDGVFRTPPWMRIIIRDPYDPFSRQGHGHTGGINIIDLANIYSCSFIETADLGVSYADGSFEVVGRFDNSDLRGCNLLV